jgi:hypothetical protein
MTGEGGERVLGEGKDKGQKEKERTEDFFLFPQKEERA